MGLRLCLIAVFLTVIMMGPARADMVDAPVVKLQSLDKVTARTMTFEVKVGSTVKFGPIYIKAQACRKAQPIDPPESAAFLQIWEVTPRGESRWIYSGWMFASSPALSAMDHPIYDVWVLDCPDQKPPETIAKKDDPAKDAPKDGIVTGAAAEPPAATSAASPQFSSGSDPVVEMPTVTLPGEGDSN